MACGTVKRQLGGRDISGGTTHMVANESQGIEQLPQHFLMHWSFLAGCHGRLARRNSLRSAHGDYVAFVQETFEQRLHVRYRQLWNNQSPFAQRLCLGRRTKRRSNVAWLLDALVRSRVHDAALLSQLAKRVKRLQLAVAQ